MLPIHDLKDNKINDIQFGYNFRRQEAKKAHCLKGQEGNREAGIVCTMEDIYIVL